MNAVSLMALIVSLIAVTLIVAAYVLARRLWTVPHHPVTSMRLIYLGGFIDAAAIGAIITAISLWVAA